MGNVAAPQKLPQQNVVRVGRYDQVTSIMIALITVFGIAVIGLSTMIVRSSQKIDVLKDTVPVDWVEDPGGKEDGNTTDPTQAGSGAAEDAGAIQADIPADEIEKVPREDSPSAVSSEAIEAVPELVPNLVASS